ncbi:MAG TPA: lysophospholipid acyltransferase family protein [Gemmatimonadales bacterium]|nr:lysophospholipid acyltransferase family protein [Gemmatimonadales bacterium]
MRIKVPPGLVDAVVRPVASAVAATWRVEMVNRAAWDGLVAAGRGFACMLWHETLLPLLWHHRTEGAVIVVSQARDGQYLSDFARAIGYRLVRGSSSRGAVGALLAASAELERGSIVALTPDGPRGPRREMKPGVLAAAQRAGVPVIPVFAEARRAWRLDSWDRFCIPRPFTRVRVAYGEPLTVGQGKEGLAAAVQQARIAMDDVERMAQWPDGTATHIG